MYYVYKYLDENDNIVYIGKTTKLQQRIKAHRYDKLSPYRGNCYFHICKSKTDMDNLERYLINQYKPKLNIMLINPVYVKKVSYTPEWRLCTEGLSFLEQVLQTADNLGLTSKASFFKTYQWVFDEDKEKNSSLYK